MIELEIEENFWTDKGRDVTNLAGRRTGTYSLVPSETQPFSVVLLILPQRVCMGSDSGLQTAERLHHKLGAEKGRSMYFSISGKLSTKE